MKDYEIDQLANKQDEQVNKAFVLIRDQIEKDIVCLRCEDYKTFEMKIYTFKQKIMYYKLDYLYDTDYPVSLNFLM